MIKKYVEIEYDLEAVKLELGNVKGCTEWLKETGVEHQAFVSYIIYGESGTQKVVNVGEYLVKGLGGQFSTANADLFELCFKVKAKKSPVKK